MLRRGIADNASHVEPLPEFVPFVDNAHNATGAEATSVAATAGSSADIRDTVVTNVPLVGTNVPPADHNWEAPDNDIVIEPPGT